MQHLPKQACLCRDVKHRLMPEFVACVEGGGERLSKVRGEGAGESRTLWLAGVPWPSDSETTPSPPLSLRSGRT